MVFGEAAGSDVCLEIVFAFDGCAGEAAEHGDLADMVEGIGDGSLKELRGRDVERFCALQEVVEGF